jgi:hypothetical protein
MLSLVGTANENRGLFLSLRERANNVPDMNSTRDAALRRTQMKRKGPEFTLLLTKHSPAPRPMVGYSAISLGFAPGRATGMCGREDLLEWRTPRRLTKEAR